MAKPTFTLLDHRSGFRLVKFEIPGGVTTPEEFAEATAEVAKDLPGDRPVLINGRGPVWGFGMLIHTAHPTPAVGCFDPRMAGYVVVESHDDRWDVGVVIPDPENPLALPEGFIVARVVNSDSGSADIETPAEDEDAFVVVPRELGAEVFLMAYSLFVAISPWSWRLLPSRRWIYNYSPAWSPTEREAIDAFLLGGGGHWEEE